MPFTCDIAGDVNGTKHNLRVQFLAPPALHDITKAAETLFTVLLQSDVAERAAAAATAVVPRDDTRPGPSSASDSRRPYERISDLFFVVESVAVLDEGKGVWVAVESGSQVRTGAQVYCFQPTQRGYTPVALVRPPSSATALAELTPATAGAVPSLMAVDALLLHERDPDGPGVIPPAERVVLWGRGTAAIYNGRSSLLPPTASEVLVGEGEPPLALQLKASGKPRSHGDGSGAADKGNEAHHRPEPMFLRPTESSARKARVSQQLSSWPAPPRQCYPSATVASKEEGIDAEEASQGSLAGSRDGQAARQQEPSHETPKPQKPTRKRNPLQPLSHSPLPIPPAALYCTPVKYDNARPRALYSNGIAAVDPQPPRQPLSRVGFSEKVRLVFDALPTESHRPFILLRDFFHFACTHGVLSREGAVREQRVTCGAAGDFPRRLLDDHRNLSPFFTDRLQDSHDLSLEGLLRAADVDCDGCVSFQEWLGFCLENPPVLELFFLFLQQGEPASAAETAWDACAYHSLARVHPSPFACQPPQPWERTHLLPPRSGPPRCEACYTIADRLAWPFQHRKLTTANRTLPPPPPSSLRRPMTSSHHDDGTSTGGSDAGAMEYEQKGPTEAPAAAPVSAGRALEWTVPYPSAMPADDFSRHVRLMGVEDALSK